MEKMAELRQLNQGELVDLLVDTQEELRTLKASHVISPLENPMRIRETRRKIAQLKTLLGQMPPQDTTAATSETT